MYRIEQSTFVKCNLVDAWSFISNPHNLNAVTPPEMEFEIRSTVPDVMFNGLLIDYRVKVPRFGRLSWTSEIKHIRSQCSFVDEQRYGPYKIWYHFHAIEESAGGVLFTDRIHYQMPFGILGKCAHVLFVKKDLQKIFSYRESALKAQFEG